MANRIVYQNGRFVPESEARLSIYDSALIYGDMVYEVVRTLAGRPYRLGEHLERLSESLATLAIDPGISLNEMERIALETLAKNQANEADDIDWQLMINISRGPAAAFPLAFAPTEQRPTIVISCYPLVTRLGKLAAAYTDGVDLFVARQRAIPPELLPIHAKVRSRFHYRLADLEAHRRGHGEWPVLVDPDGNVTEGTSYNLFAFCHGRLWTAPESDVVVGITRRVVLDLADALGMATLEDKLPLTEVRTADEMFVTGTSIGILHARSLDGAPLGDGKIGPRTLQLREALHAELGLDIAEQARRYAGWEW